MVAVIPLLCYIIAMKFQELLYLVADEPVFDTSLLLSGNVNRQGIQRQLSRWEQEGRLQQIRRGLYTLAPPYRHRTPHPFFVANCMVKASYVSCQSALARYGLIPEYTPVTVSVTTLRPGDFETPVGRYLFRHVKIEFFWGYSLVELAPDQHAFVAHPEKALLDLLYLTPRSDEFDFLHELRLQNLDRLNPQRLTDYVERTRKAKLQRILPNLLKMLQTQEEYETLQ